MSDPHDPFEARTEYTCDSQVCRDLPHATTISVYDGSGRILHGIVPPSSAQGELPSAGGALNTPPRADPSTLPSQRFERHSFEFRLQGAGSEEQGIAVDTTGAVASFVALQSMDVSLARGEPAGPTPGLVSGLSVAAGLVGGQLICSVRLADFPTDELLVIRVVARVTFLLAF